MICRAIFEARSHFAPEYPVSQITVTSIQREWAQNGFSRLDFGPEYRGWESQLYTPLGTVLV
jgi:hypothetical protein